MTISHNQNVAITMAKAFHILATCIGDKDMIDNAQEHLDCACDNGLYDYEATRHATIAAMDALVKSTSADENGLVQLTKPSNESIMCKNCFEPRFTCACVE